MKDGIINVYKPAGMTSNDVIYKVRAALGIKKLGHTGTLDPMAEGVLPIMINKGTRIAEYLDWDLKAQKMLAKAMLSKGDGEGAAKAYTQLFQMSPAEKQVSENAWGQREALLLSKQYATLQRQLDAVAAEGPRSEAAKAQNMRGDIQLAQNNLEDAVMDYLRTAILFEDVKDPEIQGEACVKAAQILEQMRDTSRAKDLYRKAATDWKGSSWAQKAQGKF